MEDQKKVIEIDAELFTLNVLSGKFEIVDAEARLGICTSGSVGAEHVFKYSLVIHDKKGKLLLQQKINSELHLYFNTKEKSLIWAVPFEDTVLTMSASIKEPADGTGGESSFDLLRREFTIRLWETNNQLPFDKFEDADYIIKSSQDPPVSQEKEKDEDDFDFEGRNDELEKSELRKKELKQLKRRQYYLRSTYELQDKEEEKEKEKDNKEDDNEDDEEEEEKKGGIRVSQIGSISSPIKKRSKNDPNKLLIVGQRVPRSFVVKQSGQLDIFSTASGMDQAEGA
ncbi:MAG: hypothetical protein EZS28_018426, partial [Streblomastix strix]